MGIISIVYLLDGCFQEYCDDYPILYEQIGERHPTIAAIDKKLADMGMVKWVHLFT